MADAIISVNNLNIGFTTGGSVIPVVKNISFFINPGEVVAIVGESGSGKSVTALSLMQLLPDTAVCSGEIFFTDSQKTMVDMCRLPLKKMAALRGNELSIIFQEPMTSLNPLLTCGFQIMENIRTHKKISAKTAKRMALSLMEKVQLPDPSGSFKKYPHQLSGGQQQRVMIAMAMSCTPKLLIADEPTTALDVTVQQNILSLLQELRSGSAMSILFISHDLGLVADIADRILVMYQGEIIEQGKTQDILVSPKHAYTRALLACRTGLYHKGNRLPVVSDFISGNNFQNTSAELRDNMHDTVKPNIIEIKGLSVSFRSKSAWGNQSKKKFTAVDNVSFSITKGEITGLVGESGCGKTTLGKAILQLIKPDSGEIFFNNIALTKIPEKKIRQMRKEIQIVFQDPYGSLNPRMTIGEAIGEPMKALSLLSSDKARREKVTELLEKVHLRPDHFRRYPYQFSGGQRQRICIARALASGPEFLIFDESVSALDISIQAQILNLITDLKKDLGFSALFISHDLAVIHYICDKILVMQQGKIIEEGDADSIFFSPRTSYTQKMMNAIPGKLLPLQP